MVDYQSQRAKFKASLSKHQKTLQFWHIFYQSLIDLQKKYMIERTYLVKFNYNCMDASFK